MPLRTGQTVRITCEGRTVDAVILLASPNGLSLMLQFEAMLAGHIGMMPVFRDGDGIYRSLIGEAEVKIEEPGACAECKDGLPSVNLKDGKPYSYCPECGREDRS